MATKLQLLQEHTVGEYQQHSFDSTNLLCWKNAIGIGILTTLYKLFTKGFKNIEIYQAHRRFWLVSLLLLKSLSAGLNQIALFTNLYLDMAYYRKMHVLARHFSLPKASSRVN